MSLRNYEFTTFEGRSFKVVSDPAPRLANYVELEDQDSGELLYKLREHVQGIKDFHARGGQPGVTHLPTPRRNGMAKTKPSTTTRTKSIVEAAADAAKKATEESAKTDEAIAKVEEPKTSKMAYGAPKLIEALTAAPENELAMAEFAASLKPKDVSWKELKEKGTDIGFPFNAAGAYINEVADFVNDNIDGVSITKVKRGVLKLTRTTKS